MENKDDILNNLVAILEGEGYRDETIRCYKNSLNRILRKNKSYDLSSDEFKKQLKLIKNKTELSQVINSIRKLKKSGIDIKVPKEEELKDIIKNKKRNRHKSYEPYKLKNALNSINRLRDEKYKLAYRLMLNSGLRAFELDKLTKSDITFSDKGIVIKVNDGKGGKEGSVNCLKDPYLEKKLSEFLICKDDKEKLFYNKSKMQNKAQELGFTCHDLRRAYAKLVKREAERNIECEDIELKKEMVKEEIMKALRHSKFDTSKKYIYSRRIKI